MENTFFNQVFQDRDGKIVIAQMPNLLQFSNEYNTLVCRAKRGTRANLGLMACRTYVKTAIPLVFWIAACLLQMTFSTGKINTGLDFIAFGSLFTWAWGELFQGVNYFRRTLGLIVLIGIVALRIQ